MSRVSELNLSSKNDDRGTGLSRKSSVFGLGSESESEGGRASTPGLRRKNSIMRSNINTVRLKQTIEEVKSGSVETESIDDLRMSIKKYMSNSLFGTVYENIIIFISVVSAGEYIHETYARDEHNEHWGHMPILDKLAVSFATIFLFDWLLNFFLADSKVFYFWSFFSWVDILTIISVFSSRGRDVPRLKVTNTFLTGLIWMLFCIQPVRILRSLRCYVKFTGIKDPVDRYATVMGVCAVVVILACAGIMQNLERFVQPVPFHTWIYYMSVTVSTVGYGDITPKTASGRVAAMLIILTAVISVPMATNELLAKMKLQSVYMRAFYTAKSRNSKHIVICGDLSSTSVEAFFAELFHEDHENTDLNAVILMPKPPSVDLILLMHSTDYFLSLTYLEGSALVDADLRRAKAETATSIFILSNKFSPNADEEDAKSILINLSIKRYISSFHRPKMLYCLQLLRPENKRHLTKKETGDIDGHDLIVCLNEIKMGIMAQAVVCPGANTLLMNLLTSFSDEAIELDEDEMEISEIMLKETKKEAVEESDEDEDSSEDEEERSSRRIALQNQKKRKGSVQDPSQTVHTTAKAWFDEYQKGCGWEIYITRLAKVFVGAKFCELSYALYERKGIVLFALQLFDRRISGASRLILNPGEFIIPSDEEYEIEAFVIAKNKAQSDLFFESMPEMNLVQTMKGNINNLATNIIKSTSVTERKKSTLKDVNRLRTSIAVGRMAKLKDEDESDDSDNEKKKQKEMPRKESKWKKLKRSALLERKVKIDSFQEVILRLEDEHFQQNYYVRNQPLPDISEVTIKTSVFQEIPTINHHTIVIGKSMRNLYDFIKPLKAKYLGPMRSTVLLFSTELPPDVWRRISVFDGIYIVRGSPLEDIHLRRAGIFRADTVVVLTEGMSAHEMKDVNDSYLVDSDAIFSYQAVKRLNPQAQVVVEIVNQSNINYLGDPNIPPLVDDPKFSPQFASGSLFTTGLLDSIVCQAYYNPEIVKVVNKLLTGLDHVEPFHFILKASEELGHMKKLEASSSESESSDEDDDKPPPALGSGAISDVNAKMSRRQLKYMNMPKDELLHRARTKLLKIPNSCLYQVNVSDLPTDKKTYGEVYKFFAAQGIIPLGILRGVLNHLRMGPKSNHLPYVYTNPAPETILYICDKIFVLSITPVKSFQQKNDIKDMLLNLQMNKKLSGSLVANSGLRHGALTGIANNPQQFLSSQHKPTPPIDSQQFLLELTEKNHKKFDEKLKQLNSDVETQLGSIIGSLEVLLQDSEINLKDLLNTVGWTTAFPDDISIASDQSERPPSSYSSPDAKEIFRKARSQSADSLNNNINNSNNTNNNNSGNNGMIPRRTTLLDSSTSKASNKAPSPRQSRMSINAGGIAAISKETGEENKADEENSLHGFPIPIVRGNSSLQTRKRSISNPVATIHEESGDSNPDEDSNNEKNKKEDSDQEHEKSPKPEEKSSASKPFPLASIMKPQNSVISSPPSTSPVPMGALSHAISNISMDFSINEEEAGDKFNDAPLPMGKQDSIDEMKEEYSDTDDNSTYVSYSKDKETNKSSNRTLFGHMKISPTPLLPAMKNHHETVNNQQNNNSTTMTSPMNAKNPSQSLSSSEKVIPEDHLIKQQQQTSLSFLNKDDDEVHHFTKDDDNLSLRSFRSLTSQQPEKIPGPKLKDIAPLPLEKIKKLQSSPSRSAKRFQSNDGNYNASYPNNDTSNSNNNHHHLNLPPLSPSSPTASGRNYNPRTNANTFISTYSSNSNLSVNTSNMFYPPEK